MAEYTLADLRAITNRYSDVSRISSGIDSFINWQEEGDSLLSWGATRDNITKRQIKAIPERNLKPFFDAGLSSKALSIEIESKSGLAWDVMDIRDDYTISVRLDTAHPSFATALENLHKKAANSLVQQVETMQKTLPPAMFAGMIAKIASMSPKPEQEIPAEFANLATLEEARAAQTGFGGIAAASEGIDGTRGREDPRFGS